MPDDVFLGVSPDRMLDLNKKIYSGTLSPSEVDQLERELNTNDTQIDNLVFRLYDVTNAGLSKAISHELLIRPKSLRTHNLSLLLMNVKICATLCRAISNKVACSPAANPFRFRTSAR